VSRSTTTARPSSASLGLAIVLAFVAACSGESTTDPSDAGPPDHAADTDAEVALLVTPPAAPRMEDWACREGWSADQLGRGESWSFSVCRPPPQLDCEVGSAQFLGDSECQLIGGACPPNGARFHDEEYIRGSAPDFQGDIVYVDPDLGSVGARGSREAPLSSIAEALTATGSGGIIALSVGRHVESLILERAVALVGACATGTTVEPPTGGEELPTLLFVEPGPSRLSNVTVTGPRIGVGTARRGVHLEVESVIVEDTQVGGLIVTEESAMSLREVVVRGVRGGPTLGTGAISVQSGSILDLDRVIVEDSVDWGLSVNHVGQPWPPAVLEASDVVVRDLLDQGVGLFVQGDATATLTGALIERSGTGVFAQDPFELPPTVTLTDVVVRDSVPNPNGEFGRGGEFHGGSALELHRVLFEGNTDAAMYMAQEGSDAPILTGTDVVARETAGNFQSRGWGLAALGDTRVELTRFLSEGNTDIGVLASESPWPNLNMTDIVVVDTQPSVSDQCLGVAILGGSEVTLSRALIARNCFAGLATQADDVDGTSPTLTLEDLTIRDTESDSSGALGHGLLLTTGALATVRRASIERNREAGIQLTGWEGAIQTRAVLEDIAITGTRRAACGEIPEGRRPSCISDGINFGGGAGLVLAAGAEIVMQRFRVTDSASVGLTIEREILLINADRLFTGRPRVDARTGEVTGNPIGLNIEFDDFDLAQLSDDVFVFGNGIDFSRNDLPPPNVDTLIANE